MGFITKIIHQSSKYNDMGHKKTVIRQYLDLFPLANALIIYYICLYMQFAYMRYIL